jgi:sensor c-di-GMP phosphodiesterase-like protein
VETPEQLRFLVTHGCEFAQGYLFAKPVDEEAYGTYLKTWQVDQPVSLALVATRGNWAEEAATG